MREADLNCRTWGAIHPCAFHRGAWGTLSLTTLQLDQCNLDVLPYQACSPRSLLKTFEKAHVPVMAHFRALQEQRSRSYLAGSLRCF